MYQPKPGTYYYLHVVNNIRFWESHPFTVASTTTRYHDSRTIQQSDRDIPTSTDEVSLLLRGEPRTSSAVFCGEGLEKPQAAMTFLLRPYDSFTGRLRDMAAATWPLPVSLRVLVDGPYGHMQSFDRFDHLLFIVGGSGIVVPLSYLEYFSNCIPRPKSVRIVWAAREFEFAAEVIRGEFFESLDGGKLSLDVYITKDERCIRTSESSNWPKEVRVLSDRPDVRDEVEDATRRSEGERLAVVACGPAKMADDARRAVVDLLASGQSRIKYFEEAFRW
jgi:predicted ferric reductase